MIVLLLQLSKYNQGNKTFYNCFIQNAKKERKARVSISVWVVGNSLPTPQGGLFPLLAIACKKVLPIPPHPVWGTKAIPSHAVVQRSCLVVRRMTGHLPAENIFERASSSGGWQEGISVQFARWLEEGNRVWGSQWRRSAPSPTHHKH